MNILDVEEAVSDWHRFGFKSELPWIYLARLHLFFSSFYDEKYLTYHLRTVDYFSTYAYQIKYWRFIGAELNKLCKTGTNRTVNAIERRLKTKLSGPERLKYGHILLVTIGDNSKERLDILRRCHDDSSHIAEILTLYACGACEAACAACAASAAATSALN